MPTMRSPKYLHDTEGEQPLPRVVQSPQTGIRRANYFLYQSLVPRMQQPHSCRTITPLLRFSALTILILHEQRLQPHPGSLQLFNSSVSSVLVSPFLTWQQHSRGQMARGRLSNAREPRKHASVAAREKSGVISMSSHLVPTVYHYVSLACRRRVEGLFA
jgi:hypothetical protein